MKCFCDFEMINKVYDNKEFYLCLNCGYLRKKKIPTKEEELDRYNKHICDDKYLVYMNNIYENIKEYIYGNRILDYGCGKIHALSDILNNNGYKAFYYDLYYYNIDIPYAIDTIILIEVFEHISDLKGLLINLKRHLNSNGRIIIKTLVVKEAKDYWYLRDITHISFPSVKSMEILGDICGFSVIYDSNKSLFILTSI